MPKLKIHDEIKRIYKQSGKTIKEIAAMCKCSQATVWNWMKEKGEPSASQMDKMRRLVKK